MIRKTLRLGALSALLVLGGQVLVGQAMADCGPAPIGNADDMAISFLRANGTQISPASQLNSTVKQGVVVYDSADNTLKLCDGVDWVSVGTGGGAGGGTSLAALTDVDLTGLANGQALVYDAVNAKWEPRNIAGAVGGIISGVAWRTAGMALAVAPAEVAIPLNAGQASLEGVTHSLTVNPERMTVTQAGRYLVFYSGLTQQNSSTASHNYLKLKVNGADVVGPPAASGLGVTSNWYATLSGVALLDLNAGDYVSLVGYSNWADNILRNAVLTITRLGGGGGTGSGVGSDTLSGLSDVDLSGLQDGQSLVYNASANQWENVSLANGAAGSTMVTGWPDVIACQHSNGSKYLLYYTNIGIGGGGVGYHSPGSSAASGFYIVFNRSTGNYASHASMGGFDCVDNAWSITDLYANSRAFNLLDSGSGAGAVAAGDVGDIQFKGADDDLAASEGLRWHNAYNQLDVSGTARVRRVEAGPENYPSAISRGDILLHLVGQNQGLEFGVTRVHNARRAWILSRHEATTAYGNVYNTLHIQPRVEDDTSYRGVVIGRPASEQTPVGRALWVSGDTRFNGQVNVDGAVDATSVLVNGVPVASSTDTYWSAVGAGNIRYAGGSTFIGNIGAAAVDWNNTVQGVHINPSGYVWAARGGGAAQLYLQSLVAGASGLVAFGVPGANVGSISTDGTGVAYSTTSDVRLKENIVNSARGLDTLMRIEVKEFNFIHDEGKRRVQGFIAQQLNEIYPEAVKVGGQEVDEPWSVDYGRITPLMVRSMQELKGENDLLRGQIDDLQAQINELRGIIKSGD